MSNHTLITSHILSGSLTKVEDLKGAGLDLNQYSRMKHGQRSALKTLAQELALEVMKEEPVLVKEASPLVLPVAYVKVPPSCYYLSKYMLETLNAERQKNGLAPGRIVRIAKGSVATTDYAAASLEEREKELASISFSLDEDIAGSHVLLVDDVRVTGMAERAALKALENANAKSITLAYIATVHEDLQHSPHIESIINHSSVKNVRHVIPFVQEEDFVITIRFLKYLLKSEVDDLRYFIKHTPNSTLRELLNAAISTGPEFLKAYAPGVSLLRKALKRRERLALGYLHKNPDHSSIEIWGNVDFASYSKFKYGDGSFSDSYGRALAHVAVTAIPKNCEKVFVTSSGFSFVPPAAHSLIFPFVDELNKLYEGEIYPFKIERTSISNGDYAKMTKEQRKNELSSKSLFVDPSIDLQEGFVLAIDDVRITGTHEKALEATLKEAGARRVKHLYVIDAWDERKNPHTEAQLNLFSIKELDAFIATVTVEDFIPNARFCKHVINLPEDELAIFMDSVPGWIIYWLDAAIKADHLQDYPAYAEGVKVYRRVRKTIKAGRAASHAFRKYVQATTSLASL